MMPAYDHSEHDERQRLFDRIMAASPDLVYLYDVRRGRNVYANRALEAILGYQPMQAQALGTSFLATVLHPDDFGAYPETMRRVGELAEGNFYEHVYRARHADGSWRWLCDRTVIFERGADSAPALVLGVVQDITEQRALQAALRERSADLSTFLETMPIAVLISHDPTGAQITGNSAAARLLRVPVGSNLSRTAPPEEHVAIHEVRRGGRILRPEELPIQYACAHAVTVHDHELEVLFENGETTHIAGYVSPLLTDSGAVRGAIAAYVDISESRRADTIERLFARLSDDLANSLDYADQLARLTRLTVPDLADFSLLDLWQGDQISRVALAHRDPSRQALLEGLRRYPPDPARRSGVPAVLRGGEALLIPLVDDVLLDGLAQDAKHLAVLRALGPRSVMVVPLVARATTLGTLTLTLTTPVRRYTERDLAMAQEFAARAALVIDNARLYQQAQQHAARMQLLAESSRVFAESSLRLPPLLDQIARHIAQHIGDCCVIRMLSDDGVWLEPVAIAHADPEALALLRQIVAEEPLAVGEGITGRALQQGRPILIETVSPEDARALVKPGHLAYLDRVGLASVLVIPLLVRDQTIGVLFLSRDTALRPYTTEDQTLLEDIASRAALAINHARLYEAEQRARARAERTADRMARLQTVTAVLAQALTPAQMAEVIVQHCVAALGAMSGTVRRLSADGLYLEDTHATGVPGHLLAGIERMPLDASTPVAEAVRRGADLWFEDTAAIVGRYPQLAAMVREQGYQAFAALLLELDGRTIGVLGIAFGLPQVFDSEDRAFLRAMAQQCTQALERARLYEAERQARAEAEAAVRVRDQFLSVAAHELKTPLTPLLGQAQLLERRAAADAQLDPRYRRSALVIAEQANRLSQLVARLLDLSRLQSARAALSPELLDLAELALRLAEELRPTLTLHTLDLVLPSEPLLLNGDPVRLGQVLGNLLQNAIKYSPAGGTVALELRREGGWACVEVRDQGIGIPPEALPQLFTPFFRAANAARSATGGMGLGLSVVKELVELHGGRISVESIEGQGSRFCVWLQAPNEVQTS